MLVRRARPSLGVRLRRARPPRPPVPLARTPPRARSAAATATSTSASAHCPTTTSRPPSARSSISNGSTASRRGPCYDPGIRVCGGSAPVSLRSTRSRKASVFQAFQVRRGRVAVSPERATNRATEPKVTGSNPVGRALRSPLTTGLFSLGGWQLARERPRSGEVALRNGSEAAAGGLQASREHPGCGACRRLAAWHGC